MKKIFYTSIILLTTLLCSCGEEVSKHIFNERVDFTINVNAWDAELRNPSVAKTYTTPRAEGFYLGFGGLLVYSNPNDIQGSNIYGLFAYDLACPYEKRKQVRLAVNKRDIAICEECGSEYSIIDGHGTKLSGPSKTGLQVYRVRADYSKPGVFRITR